MTSWSLVIFPRPGNQQSLQEVIRRKPRNSLAHNPITEKLFFFFYGSNKQDITSKLVNLRFAGRWNLLPLDRAKLDVSSCLQSSVKRWTPDCSFIFTIQAWELDQASHLTLLRNIPYSIRNKFCICWVPSGTDVYSGDLSHKGISYIRLWIHR